MMHEFEISERLGDLLWGLRKGRTHKYIRRVPKPGGGYRYFYRTSGVTRAVGSDLVPGAKFRLTHEGQAGHFEVIGRSGDTVTLRHDESGGEMRVSAEALGDLLKREHADVVQAQRERTQRRLDAARAHGTPKQVARLEAEAKRFGVSEPAAASTQALADDIAKQVASGAMPPGMMVNRRKQTFSGTVDGQHVFGQMARDGVTVTVREGGKVVATATAARGASKPAGAAQPLHARIHADASAKDVAWAKRAAAGVSTIGPPASPTQADLDEFRRQLDAARGTYDARGVSDANDAARAASGMPTVDAAFSRFWAKRRNAQVRETMARVVAFAKDKPRAAAYVDPSELAAWRARPGHTVVSEAPNVVGGDFDAAGASAAGAFGAGATVRTHRVGADIPAGRVVAKRLVGEPGAPPRVEYLVKPRGGRAEAKAARVDAIRDAGSAYGTDASISAALGAFTQAAGGDWQVEKVQSTPDVSAFALRSPRAGIELIFERRGFGSNEVRVREIGAPGTSGRRVADPSAVIETAVPAAKNRR